MSGRAAAEAEALWVHGVVEGVARVPEVEGIDGAAVDVVAHAGLAALVSPVPLPRFGEEALRNELEDLDRVEELARAHERVLDAALAGGTVVPFRLCTICSDAGAVRVLLEEDRAALAAAVVRLAGASEWGVKALLREEPSCRAPRAAATGTAYLARRGEERQARAERREEVEASVTEIHARLAEHAEGAVVLRPQDRRLSGHTGAMVLNAAYLVPRAREEAFRSLVAGLAERGAATGLDLVLTGPWPGFHFATEETDG